MDNSSRKQHLIYMLVLQIKDYLWWQWNVEEHVLHLLGATFKTWSATQRARTNDPGQNNVHREEP